MLRYSILSGAILLFASLSGCAPDVESAQSSTSVASATPTVAATLAVTPAPPVATPAGPVTLTLWIPESLLPLEDEALNALLDAEINEFVTVEDDIRVEIRRKASDDVGGIISTLRAASSVAPGALPDVTLLRREDVLEAVEAGLIQPLEGRIASAIIADLYPAALRLGRAEDQLYGLPYLLDIYLFAYRAAEPDSAVESTFEAILERGDIVAFPGYRASGIADILWLQYIADGGQLLEGAALELTPSVVAGILRSYERLNEARLIAPGVLDYAEPAEYVSLLENGRIDSGIISSGDLRALAAADPPLKYGPVPSESGTPLTLVDGWMWVIVTTNAERQALAGRFLNWMMDSGRHSAYAQAIAMPPSQRASLRRWSVEGLDNALVGSLLTDSPPLQPEVGANSAARAFQEAWQDVLAGRATSEEALSSALEP